MDELDSTFNLYPNATIIFAGDFNADPGFDASNPKEQGVILLCYLRKLNYISTHLTFGSSAQVFTYESEAHGTFPLLIIFSVLNSLMLISSTVIFSLKIFLICLIISQSRHYYR